MLVREVTVIVGAYLLAAIPVGAALLAGRMSPLYRIPTSRLCRCWSWFALVLVASMVTLAAVNNL